ncbi:hypothetical protein Tco_0491845 [Tanacetum coccineum]
MEFLEGRWSVGGESRARAARSFLTRGIAWARAVGGVGRGLVRSWCEGVVEDNGEGGLTIGKRLTWAQKWGGTGGKAASEREREECGGEGDLDGRGALGYVRRAGRRNEGAGCGGVPVVGRGWVCKEGSDGWRGSSEEAGVAASAKLRIRPKKEEGVGLGMSDSMRAGEK